MPVPSHHEKIDFVLYSELDDLFRCIAVPDQRLDFHTGLAERLSNRFQAVDILAGFVVVRILPEELSTDAFDDMEKADRRTVLLREGLGMGENFSIHHSVID